MQRGSNNPSNYWQYLKNRIPPGILSRLSLLSFIVRLLRLQQINRFNQDSNSDLIQPHLTQLILQQDYFLQLFSTYSYIWLTYFPSFLFFQYISRINNNNSIKFIIIFIIIIIMRLLKLFSIRINYTDITNEITNTFL